MFGLFKKKEKIVPTSYPGFDVDLKEWMEEMVSYWEKTKPEKMYKLFCPSFGDYLPGRIQVSLSYDIFMKHIEDYREIKKRYPEVVKKAEKEYCSWSKFICGDPLDYY